MRMGGQFCKSGRSGKMGAILEGSSFFRRILHNDEVQGMDMLVDQPDREQVKASVLDGVEKL